MLNHIKLESNADAVDTAALIAYLKALEKAPTVYQTYLGFPDSEKSCTFITTSKDIYLLLGRFEYQSQQNLASFIVRSLEEDNTTAGLFIFPDDDDEGILATMSQDAQSITVHLSDAR